jgi:predicted metal-binding membrane protein
VSVPRRLRLPAALVAFALAGWVVSAVAMPDMASMASFLWLWIAMSAAMMLPAVVPAVSLAERVGRSGTVFVGGYFAVWAVTGIAAFEVTPVLMGAGRWLAAGAIAAAAVYQLSPFKDACLRRCRSPLGLLLRRGALGAGLEHGVLCLGCCWALMLALLAPGAGSLLWMAAVAAAIFVEKVTSLGARASAPLAVGLLGAAVWVAL